MPTYQYACTECGERLEAVQKFTDEPLTVCPMCQGRLRKVFSAVGVVFKGSGFYRTDSRAPVGAGANGSAKSDGRTEAKSGEGATSKANGSGSGSGGSGDAGSKAASSAASSASASSAA